MRLQRAALMVGCAALAAGCAADTIDAAPTTTGVSPTTVAVTTTTAATTTTAGATTTTPVPSDGVVELHGRIVDDFDVLDSPLFPDAVAVLRDESALVEHTQQRLTGGAELVVGQVVNADSYQLDLPAGATAPRHDVDNDARVDPGVAIYSVSVVANTFGDPFVEERDLFGGGLELRSVDTVTNDDGTVDLIGGQIVIYAPDARQEFPTDGGDDGRLFTADDPVAKVPRGWSVVDLRQEPFVVHHEPKVGVDVKTSDELGQDEIATNDYVEAFDQLVDRFRTKYAFTDLKHIDWDALAAEFRPRFEAAQRAHDEFDFRDAVDAFIQRIPDIHVKSNGGTSPFFASAGTIGLGLVETRAQGVIAATVDRGGPADQAGIVVGARVVAIGGRPIADVIASTQVVTGPFSNPAMERLEKVAYSTYFEPFTQSVSVTYVNPGQAEQTVTLAVGFNVGNIPGYAGLYADQELPIEVEVVDGFYEKVTISSFIDDFALMIRLWERALQYAEDNDLELILDMRANGGGSLWVALQMAAYFETPFGAEDVLRLEHYDPLLGRFAEVPGAAKLIVPPGDRAYSDTFAILVGPGCISACELFSYLAQRTGRGTVVGHSSSQGGGGEVEIVRLPDNTFVSYSVGRLIDADGQPVVEGTGVVPDVLVPNTVDSVTREANGEDVVLTAAEDELF